MTWNKNLQQLVSLTGTKEQKLKKNYIDIFVSCLYVHSHFF